MIDLTGKYVDNLIRTNVDSVDFSARNSNKTQQCGDLEQDSLECLEAYGARRGRKVCENFILDYKECLMNYIQTERVNQMRRERIKQVLRGERKVSQLYDSIKPPRDSYQSGPFYN